MGTGEFGRAHRAAVSRATVRWIDVDMSVQTSYVDAIADLLHLAVHHGIDTDAVGLCDLALHHYTSEYEAPEGALVSWPEVGPKPPGSVEIVSQSGTPDLGPNVRVGPWPGAGV